MSVSVTLQKSTAGNLDAVSSITQHIVLIIGLLFLLGFVGFVFLLPFRANILQRTFAIRFRYLLMNTEIGIAHV